jgi:hypothetical protein
MHIGIPSRRGETTEVHWFGKTAQGAIFKLKADFVRAQFVAPYRLRVREYPGYWVSVPEGDAAPPLPRRNYTSQAHVKEIPMVQQQSFALCAPYALANAMKYIGDEDSASILFSLEGEFHALDIRIRQCRTTTHTCTH